METAVIQASGWPPVENLAPELAPDPARRTGTRGEWLDDHHLRSVPTRHLAARTGMGTDARERLSKPPPSATRPRLRSRHFRRKSLSCLFFLASSPPHLEYVAPSQFSDGVPSRVPKVHLKLTDLAIANLKPASPQIDYWDMLLPSFGVRVGLRRKTFIVMLGTPRKRRTLGHYPLMNLQTARERARSLLASPNAPAAIFVADAVDEYLRARTTRRRTSTTWMSMRRSCHAGKTQ